MHHTADLLCCGTQWYADTYIHFGNTACLVLCPPAFSMSHGFKEMWWFCMQR